MTPWYLLSLRYLIFQGARHYLLCEVLKPGMTKNEVLAVLNRAGEFWMRDNDSPSPNIDLHISFTDPKGKFLYGAFDLGFYDYKYNLAYISGFEGESIEVICDFTQLVHSTSETPKP